MRDEPQPVRRAVARELLDRLAAGLGDDGAILLGIALAIQVTSWWETRLRRAVTSRRPPRRADSLTASIARARDRTATG